jgi:hypothetical protein
MPRRNAANLSVCVTATVLALGVLATGPSGAQELPSRKPGLWEISMQTTNAPSQVVRQCIDAATDQQMQRFGQGMDLKSCSKNVWRKDGDRYIGESECRLGNSVATTRAVFGGDFSTAYRGEIDARYAPPIGGVGASKVTITARWRSVCPTGWKAGDMEMPGMGRMNVTELMAARAAKRN